MPSCVRLDHRPDGVAVLTFDQPGSKANVLTTQMWSDFGAALDSLAGRADVRGLVLASAKPGIFIAGADLKLLGSAPGPNDPAVRAFIEQGLRVLEKLEALPFPTCAAIDGVALGGGLEVALACDFRIAGTNPRVELGLPEVKLGLIPGWGGTQRLPRVFTMGLELAGELLVTAASLDADRAETWDLIDETADSAVLIDAAGELSGDWRGERARKFGAVDGLSRPPSPGGPVAAREAVRVLSEGAGLPLAEAIKLETEAFLRLAGSDESKRLIAAFFAGRKRG